ncbi:MULTISPECIES: hypothetical protein [unclassified Rhodococcus (in: high G+C Gram-positive bacteria)]|uniref:hypothetical protein n=1 Tax=unclassified Rhodococcus (in: high G+C Gram-positive bacteria) TaxID=192944 RepID=UPI00314004BE
MSTVDPKRVISDPVGLISDLVAEADPGLDPGRARTVVVSTVGGRAKSRRIAAALVARPAVLADGRSPAPRAIGDLLLALRKAGATAIAAPCCADCGKQLRTLMRRGQHWYCSVCEQNTAACAGCGNLKQVRSHDRDGHPRCAQCPDPDDRDPIAVIHAAVAALDPAVPRDAIAGVLDRCCRQRGYQRRVAWALEADPALLTGEGHRAPLRVIPRLVEHLHASGVRGIVLPTCPGCGRQVRIDKPLDGQRVCRTCIAHSRIEECARCGARREPVSRDEHRRPICANCFCTDPANLEICLGCGRRRPVGRRTTDGPLCQTCHTLPIRTCSICGDTTPCGISRRTGRPWCPTCQRRAADCGRCGRHTAIAAGTLTEPLCDNCAPPPAWRDCPTCSDPDHPTPGRCGKCLTNQRLYQVMGPVTADMPPGLLALRHDIATAEHSITAQRWLTKQPVTTVLSDLAAGRMPLTHAAFDTLPRRPATEYLRHTLVAVGALPERDEELVRLERTISEFLATQQNPEWKKLLHRYLVWHLLRRLRTRNNGRPTTRQQMLRIRSHARAAAGLLTWLATRGLTLASCGRTDLDQWITDPAGGYRYETGTFLRWAYASKLTTAYLPARRWNGPANPIDDDNRWTTARTLLHDNTIDSVDRLAGLLVLLYAQGPSTIALLTVDQISITNDNVHISFGRTPIRLPEPVDDLARTVFATRKGHATIGATTPSRWLFPGGQPGRPISAQRLKLRLNQLGIRPNQARSTALFGLATQIPAAILARTLGISVSSAVRWQQISAGDWTTYAANIADRRGHSDSCDT